MEDFKLFDLIPNGVIVFKDNKIEYMSKHLLDVLNITYLDKNNALEILCKTIGLNKDDLLDFFINHNYFKHGKKIIQIEHNSYDNLDIFSFILINMDILKIDVDKDELKPLQNNIDKKVVDFFKLKNLQKVKALTFFKGLPLKNFAKVIRITKDTIEISVDSKHLISLKEKNEILLILNEKEGSSVIEGEIINNDKNIFTIKNFSLSKKNAHLRRDIRIKNNNELLVKIDDRKFKVYDFSLKGISIFIKDKEEEKFLKIQKSIRVLVGNDFLKIDIQYLKTIYENNKILKIIFNIFVTDEVSLKINNYIISKQNEIIREIHEHIKYI